MDARVRLEVYIARPPTRKCREVVAVMEEAVRRYPDQARLVVLERGAEWSEEPSRALRYAIDKGSTVPLCFVGGKPVVGGKVPKLGELVGAIRRALANAALSGQGDDT